MTVTPRSPHRPQPRSAGIATFWLSLAAACLIVGVLYGRAVGFSFLFDDTFDLPRVEGRSYLSLLTSSEGYSYYRPGPFLIWKLSHGLLGYYSAPLLHLLTLTAHALGGWLFFLLVARLGAGLWAAFPALLFLTYPFSYQNVAIVGTLFHPMAAAAILASLYLYLVARSAQGRKKIALHAAALGSTMVALWSHESGVVILPLLIGLELLLWHRSRQRGPILWLVAHVIATLAFGLTWLLVERAPSAETVVLDDMQPKALFFAQGFTYPFSAQVRWMEDALGWAPGILEVTLLSVVLVGGAYAAAWWRAGRARGQVIDRFVFPLAGVAIAVAATAPALARLSWPYVQDAPRLLYLVGAGAALFWGLLPMLDFGKRWFTLGWRVVTSLLLVGVVAQSWAFIDTRMEMFTIGSSAVDQVVTMGERHAGRGVLVADAPSWLAKREYEYPYGHLGVQVIPTYIGLDRVIYTSSRHKAVVEAASMTLSPEVDGVRFTFGPHGAALSQEDVDRLLREGRVAVVVDRDGDGFTTREVGRVVPGGAEAPGSLDLPANDAFAIGQVRSRADTTGLTVYLSWHVLQAQGDEQVTVELVDQDGVVIDRYVGAALGGLLPVSTWRAGDRIDDSFLFQRPPPGVYQIRAGVGDTILVAAEIYVP